MTRSDSMLGDMKAFLNMRGLMRRGTPFMSMNCTPVPADGKTSARGPEAICTVGRQGVHSLYREQTDRGFPEGVCIQNHRPLHSRKHSLRSQFLYSAARAGLSRVSPDMASKEDIKQT